MVRGSVQPQMPLKLLSIWWPAILGLLVLYVPTYISMAGSVWQQSEYGHGPIILVAALWLISRRWTVLVQENSAGGASLPSLMLVFGLLLYMLGRSQDIVMFEVGSQIPVLFSCIWLLSGWRAAKAMWFPIVFFVFMVPLPGFFVDSLTGHLKHLVSGVVEFLLYAADYPIARIGVVLTVGDYQLLVADACSGLNSMFSLSAMGLLYVYLRERRGWLGDGILILSILPIAFVANIARVMALVLITYHFGDAAGQGFMHDFAGIAEFFIAMIALFTIDFILGFILYRRRYVQA